MNSYAFFASVIQSLASIAWPAALVACVWIFRERLVSLLPRLRVKHKDWEASFLDQAEIEAAKLPPAGNQKLEPTPEEKTRFEQIAEISPRAAILEARAELDEAIKSLAMRYQAIPVSPRSLLEATRALRKNQAIDEHVSALLDDLRTLGNSAAHSHDRDFTKSEAMRYRKLVDTVIADVSRTE